jgi:biotin carboxyl carrier protein
MKYRLERAGNDYELDVELTADGCIVRGPDGEPHTIRLELRSDGSYLAITPWGDEQLLSARRGAELWASVSGRRLHARVERVRASQAGASGGAAAGSLTAPMPGKLLRVSARVGDQVVAGQALAVIEAMKMENELVSPIAGVVTEVALQAPSAVEKGALILKVEPR